MEFERFYSVIPLFASVVWCGGLMAMLITWAGQGHPHYISQDGNIPFVSDIGASTLKPLFIVMCAITAMCFTLSLVLERLLRHLGRLPSNMTRREKVCAGIAIFGAALGGAGLILLSIFDTRRHDHLHRLFLLIFIVGVAISAIFTVLEFHWLSKHYAPSGSRTLRRSYLAKAIIVAILVVLAIVFGATMDTRPTVGAIVEWVIAFGFAFYLLTFFFDLHIAPHVTEEATQHLRSSVQMRRY